MIFGMHHHATCGTDNDRHEKTIRDGITYRFVNIDPDGVQTPKNDVHEPHAAETQRLGKTQQCFVSQHTIISLLTSAATTGRRGKKTGRFVWIEENMLYIKLIMI